MSKTILLTGANGNLGRATVAVLHEAGHKIHAVVGSGELPGTLQKQITSTHEIDLLDQSATGQLVTSLTAHPLHAAVLLVGGFVAGDLAHTSTKDIDQQIDLNFKTAWNLVQPLMAYFEKQGGGQFIFIGSGPGIDPTAGKGVVAYALAKSLIFRLAEIVNQAGKRNGIKASVVVPGTMDTPVNRKAMPDADFSKWVQPSDVAKNIEFLLSEPAQALQDSILKVYG